MELFVTLDKNITKWDNLPKKETNKNNEIILN